jgi:TonB-dependent receptor
MIQLHRKIRLKTGWFLLATVLFSGGVHLSRLTAQESTIPGTGSLMVRVFDKKTEDPIEGVSIVVGSEAFDTSNKAGRCVINSLFPDMYVVSFTAPGYRPGLVTEVEIKSGEQQVLIFPMEGGPVETPSEEQGELGQVFVLEEFVISATVLQDSDFVLRKMRFESNLAVDTLSGADFKKFAAGDVGEVLLKVPGITVQSGKFAVIRGLDERYTSTLFNGVPVPSPDPDKQSVPLDLFPSEIVGSLIVAKTFSPEQPGNSVGGNIQINSVVFPESFEVKFAASLGFQDNASDRYLSNGDRPEINVDLNDLNSPENTFIGNQFAANSRLTPRQDDAPLDREINLELGNTHSLLGRKFRYFLTVGMEDDYRSTFGTEEKWQGRNGASRFGTLIIAEGDLARGVLSKTSGRFDLTESTYENRETALFSANFELDKKGQHAIGINTFYNNLSVERASLRENGTFENADRNGDGYDSSDVRSLGGIADRLLSFHGNDFESFQKASLYKTNVVDEKRILRIYQISGSHEFSGMEDGLQATWTISKSNTSQDETASINTAGVRLEDGSFVTGTDTNNSVNRFMRPTLSWRNNREDQDFYRMDISNTLFQGNAIAVSYQTGISFEDTERTVRQEFYLLDKNFQDIEELSPSFPTREGAIQNKYAQVNQSVDSGADALSNRDIKAAYLSAKIAVGESFDVTFGARVEDIRMDTTTSSAGDFFNFELLRDSVGPSIPLTAVINSAIMGLPGPLSPDFTGLIDEKKLLPMVAINYRIQEKWRFLLSFSQTVARPSFKEFTYVTNQDPITLNYVSGNPTLETSDVTSYDARVEYHFSEGTDLIALSVFQKRVDDPIEKTILAGKVDTEIFFNNPNSASLKGIELEARKDLVFLKNKFLKSFSLGCNLTYIDAKVRIPETMRNLLSGTLELSNGGVLQGDYFLSKDAGGRIPAPEERQLFSQPEWIANFDVTYYHATFGTRLTLSLFAQSKVLVTAAGTTGTSGTAITDRFMDSYHSLNLSLSQPLAENLKLGISVKNLTDSERSLVYDSSLVTTSPERIFRVGRSFAVSISGNF